MACFFFSGHFWHDFCFFFFLGKVYLHSLTRLKNVFFFFSRCRKKKNGFFTHSLDFCRKIQKNKLFPGKKNVTFGNIVSQHKNPQTSLREAGRVRVEVSITKGNNQTNKTVTIQHNKNCNYITPHKIWPKHRREERTT